MGYDKKITIRGKVIWINMNYIVIPLGLAIIIAVIIFFSKAVAFNHYHTVENKEIYHVQYMTECGKPISLIMTNRWQGHYIHQAYRGAGTHIHENHSSGSVCPGYPFVSVTGDITIDQLGTYYHYPNREPEPDVKEIQSEEWVSLHTP